MKVPRYEQEEWLAKRLGEHGIHDGLTTTESRRERFREAIAKVGSCVIVGTNPKTGKCETYAELFERMYGVPFETEAA